MKRFVSILLSMLMTISVFSFSASLSANAEQNGISNTGKTYYVDAENGSDNASGLSEANAWKTLDNVNKTTFEPGSAILLKRGCVWKDTFLWPKGAGDKDNLNYISCYGDESLDLPYISSIYDDELEGLPKNDACLYLDGGQNYWDISNLSLYNSTNGTGDQYVVNVNHTGNAARIAGVSIHDCIINGSSPANWDINSRSGLTGIAVFGKIDDVLIENNEISNVKAVGISVNGGIAGCNSKGVVNSASAKNVVIRGNTLYNIGKDGILTNNCVEPLVEYNVCGKAHSFAKTSAHVAMWPFACYGALYQYNEAYDTRTIYDGQGFDCDYQCYYTTFQYNYSHNNVGGFMLICTEAKDWNGGLAYNVGSTVRYNISQGDSHYIFTLCDAIDDTRIYNNTIYASRNSGTATNVFFSYDKGVNSFNNRSMPNNTLIANNIFWLDTMKEFTLDKNTETVMKNNLFGGRYASKAPANGTVTTKGEDSDGNTIYYYKEVKDNIIGADPLFINGGYAALGRESCDVYKLYKGSEAIGNGIYIEDGFHKCPNDFFGNAIDKNNVNIGAYQGSGLERENYIFDNKYYKMIDFEDNSVGALGVGLSSSERMSGISRCIEATNSDGVFVDITDKSSALNSKTNSKKALRFVNENDDSATVSAKFYTLKSDLKNANGLRIYFNPNGVKQKYTVSMDVVVDNKTVTYSKTITASTAGYRVFTFNEKYTNSNNKRVTTDVMRTMTAVSVKATLQPDSEVYVDDIQLNNGEMDDIEAEEIITNESADTTMVEDFEQTTVGENTSYGNATAGPNGNPRGGSAICENGTKAIYITSNTSSRTAYSGRFLYKQAFDNLKSALKNDTLAEGIQFNLYTVGLINGVELTDEQKYLASDRYNKYQLIFNGTAIDYEKPDGTIIQLSGFTNGDAKLQTDSNNLCRISFDELYATYTDNGDVYKVYLSSLSSDNQKKWKESISSISVNYTTIGKDLGAGVFQYTYLDNLAIFKNIKHTASDWIVVTKASCLINGVKEKRCTVCNKLLDTATIAAPGHTNGSWVVTKAATCTENGQRQLNCAVCNKVIKTETINASGHNFETKVVKATCTNDGYTVEICKNCSYAKDKTNIVSALGHQHTKWVIDKAPTCTENGSSHQECIDCGATIKKSVELAGHQYEITVVKADCYNDGYTLHKCRLCNDEYKSDIVPHKEHNPDASWTIIRKATCLNEGKEVKYCTECGEVVDTRAIAKTAHTASASWTVVRKATCLNQGQEVKYCTECGEVVDTRAIAKTAHTAAASWTVVRKATCLNQGQEVKYCTECGEVVDTRAIAKTAHTTSASWTVVRKATCSNEGREVKYCTECGEVVDTRVIAKISHTASASWTVVRKATCLNDGKEVKYCTECGEVVDTRVIAKTAHTASANWTIIRNATCLNQGQEVKYCTECGEVVDTRAIAKTSHKSSENWVVVKQATTFSNGEEVKYCISCNEILETRIIEKLPEPPLPTPTTTTNPPANNGSSNQTTVVTVTVDRPILLKKPVLSKPKLAKGKVTVKYKAVAGATGYEVSILKNNKWKTYSTKKLSLVIKKLKKGTKYKIRVRAFVKMGADINYSDYSKTKTIKAK